MHKTGFIILAGGIGKRFNSTIPKQFFKIGKYNSIEIILNEISKNTKINNIVIVYNKKDTKIIKKITKKYNNKKFKLIKSGITRQQSSLKGLKSLKKNNIKKVLIHDGCRPLIRNFQINSIIKFLDKYDACVPLISNVDLARFKRGNKLIEFNSKIFLTQTPQGFNYKKILKANINHPFLNAKDDFELINKNNNNSIKYIRGDRRNIKITYKDDLNFFNFINQKNIKYGIGYDIHAFNRYSKRRLKLCGVKIKYYPLIGHSDADVGYHAICDSIFGALGIGDIGKIFKNTDLRWKNANSKIFLEFAKNKIDEFDSKIINIDINFICEKPKISKYSQKMKHNISKILCIKESQINIKATTNEKINFIGNGEGIAAESIVSLSCE